MKSLIRAIHRSISWILFLKIVLITPIETIKPVNDR